MSLYQLGDKSPTLAPTSWVAPNATVIGDVHLGAQSSVWWNTVIRGDTDRISIGERSNIQDGSVLHTDAGIHLQIGNDVTVGHMVMIHGCTIGDNCLIGIGSIILNRAVIGRNSLVGANTLVAEGKVFPEGVLILGSPGKVVRELTEEEIAKISRSAEHYAANGARYATTLKPL